MNPRLHRITIFLTSLQKFLYLSWESKVLSVATKWDTSKDRNLAYEFALNRPRGTMCMIIFHRNVTTGETRRTLINKEKSMEELFVHGTRLFASCQRLDLTHSKPVEPGGETRGERKVACLNLGRILWMRDVENRDGRRECSVMVWSRIWNWDIIWMKTRRMSWINIVRIRFDFATK